MKARRTNLFITAAVLIWFLADTGRVRESAFRALQFCAASVIPALFPFLVVTGLLISSGFGAWASPFLSPLMTDLYRLPGSAGSALLMGFLGGYPVGARTAADLYRLGYLTRDETERLLTFCDSASPAFLIGVLGNGVFGGARAGIWLLLIHVLSTLLTGLCFRGHAAAHAAAPPETPSAMPPEMLPAFVEAVRNAASAMLYVCAFVVFFSVLARPVKDWNHPAAAPLVGLLELFSLIPLLTSDSRGFVLAAFCAGWGGLSALGQTAAVLENTGLPLRPCLLGRAVRAAFSALLAAAVVCTGLW